jgi:DNA-binding XRE family transcriptional regulator
MNQSKKNKQAAEVRRIMTEKNISVAELARTLKVTAQTVYNMRDGKVSEQLFEHTFILLDNWEESK